MKLPRTREEFDHSTEEYTMELPKAYAEGAPFEGVVGEIKSPQVELALLKEVVHSRDKKVLSLEEDLRYMQEQYQQHSLQMEAEILELRRRVKTLLGESEASFSLGFSECERMLEGMS